MGHVVNHLPWCTIDIDTLKGSVFFRERWLYTWRSEGSSKPWTYHEEAAFHGRIDRVIWREWSGNRVVFTVQGTSDFAQRFQDRDVPIDFDIQWVKSSEHWNVTVYKIPPAEFRQSEVNWPLRTIELDTNDFDERLSGQIPVVHEFGHAIGYSRYLNSQWGDEYKSISPYQADTDSRMNEGNELRNRFFEEILEELNAMIPGTTFLVKRAQ